MSGLRERQKTDRERRIIEAATRLFRETGFAGSRIEAIAADAGIAVGTVYNYFESKGDILVAIVAVEVGEVLNAGNRLLEAPPADVETAIEALIAIYLDHSLVYLDKDMWRNAMALTTQFPDTRFAAKYNQLDELLTDQVCALIGRLQQDGRVRPGIDARAVGELLFYSTNMMFTMFVKSTTMDLATLKSAIARQIHTLTLAIRA